MSELCVRYRMVARKMSSDAVTLDAVKGDQIVVLYWGEKKWAVS